MDESQLKERKMTKDEWVHGSLLIINELLRCSNVEGEVSNMSTGLFVFRLGEGVTVLVQCWV